MVFSGWFFMLFRTPFFTILRWNIPVCGVCKDKTLHSEQFLIWCSVLTQKLSRMQRKVIYWFTRFLKKCHIFHVINWITINLMQYCFHSFERTLFYEHFDIRFITVALLLKKLWCLKKRLKSVFFSLLTNLLF